MEHSIISPPPTGEGAQVAPRFELHFLPVASPQLNPIGKDWKCTRRLCMHNRCFPRSVDVITVAEHTFEGWRRGSATLRRLCAID